MIAVATNQETGTRLAQQVIFINLGTRGEFRTVTSRIPNGDI
jgi:hypothetical protein